MDPREEWIRELERRQDNIDPIRRIPNGALFQGRLINGNLNLNRVQRAGAVFLGSCSVLTGIFFAFTAIVNFRSGLAAELGFILYTPLSLWIGWKMIRNAVVNDPEKVRPRKP